jgi:predicted transcriptional regulator
MTTKELVRQTLDGLPDDVTIDEVIERLYLLRKIEEGLRQAEAGDVIDHEDVKREFRNAVDIEQE